MLEVEDHPIVVDGVASEEASHELLSFGKTVVVAVLLLKIRQQLKKLKKGLYCLPPW